MTSDAAREDAIEAIADQVAEDVTAAVEREVERGNDLARKLNAAEGELERVERELRVVERGLSPLCPCSSGGPNCEGPLQECPFHGDGDTFVAEVQRLRARDEAAKAVVQIWTEVRGRPNARFPVPLVGVLDALARAHQEAP